VCVTRDHMRNDKDVNEDMGNGDGSGGLRGMAK
jgi:hypothetical protein